MAGSSAKKNSNESTKKKRKLTNSQDREKSSKSARKKKHVEEEEEERCAVDEIRTLENTEGDTQTPVEKIKNFQWRNLDLVLALDMRTLTAEK